MAQTNTIQELIDANGVVSYRYVPDGTNCAQRDLFLRPAAVDVLPVRPDPIAGYQWTPQGCIIPVGGAGVVTMTDEEWNRGGTVPDPGTADPGDESNVQFFTSTSQDDGGPL